MALALNGVYTVGQALAGIVLGSVALLADAGHNLSDVLALGLAATAVWWARRPATPTHSFGFRRAEILGALINGLSVVAIAAVIIVEAARRVGNPPEVAGGWVMLIAGLGVLVNAVSVWIIHRAARGSRNLNLRASIIHLAGDTLASVGVVLAGFLVVTLGWEVVDPLVAIMIGVVIIVSAWKVLRDAVLVLFEASPSHIDPEAVGTAMVGVPGVQEVHDLHVWSVSSDFPAMSAHVIVGAGIDCHHVRSVLETLLSERFQIGHATLQMEHRQSRHLTVGS